MRNCNERLAEMATNAYTTVCNAGSSALTFAYNNVAAGATYVRGFFARAEQLGSQFDAEGRRTSARLAAKRD